MSNVHLDSSIYYGACKTIELMAYSMKMKHTKRLFAFIACLCVCFALWQWDYDIRKNCSFFIRWIEPQHFLWFVCVEYCRYFYHIGCAFPYNFTHKHTCMHAHTTIFCVEWSKNEIYLLGRSNHFHATSLTKSTYHRKWIAQISSARKKRWRRKWKKCRKKTSHQSLIPDAFGIYFNSLDSCFRCAHSVKRNVCYFGI